jgi:phosphoserine aminotransferase
MLNHKGSGMSIMEMSHRSKEFMAVAAEAEKNLRDVLGVPDDYKVLFMQGGATLQFSCIPFNTLGGEKTTADYLVTGQWGEKAAKECNKYGTAQISCNTKSSKFTMIPEKSEWKLSPDAAYVHYCCNETVNGVEFHSTPDVGSVPLVGDLSSNFFQDQSKLANIHASTLGSKRTWAQQDAQLQSLVQSLRAAKTK